jgi:hypothetical protein
MVEKALSLFRKIPLADDRVARCLFRKHLILSDMSRGDDAGQSLNEARQLKQELQGSWSEDDTMEDYDSLVSYYNK